MNKENSKVEETSLNNTKNIKFVQQKKSSYSQKHERLKSYYQPESGSRFEILNQLYIDHSNK